MLGTGAHRTVIKAAGKTTAIMQFFAVGLVVVLGTIYLDISGRYTAMQSGIRESAMWSVYQLDREARFLTTDLAVMLATGDLGMPAQKRLSVRYDILYSRMDMLDKAKFERFFAIDETVAKQLHGIRKSVFENVGIFDDITNGVPASRASLVVAQVSFQGLLRDTEQLVTYTNSNLSSDRADQRQAVTALAMKSLILIGFLVVIVGALIFTLHRQLRSVRAAGKSFEKMAADLENTYEAAEVGNRAKSQFMATMSHEIRSPLNAILGTVELMELTPNDPEVSRNLKTIAKSGEALLEIINEILDYSKIEHGKLELEKRDVDVRSLAEGAVEMIRGRALESGNTVVLQMPADMTCPYIRSDATRLRQVVLNLMSNAVKFTQDGIVTLVVRERTERENTILRMEVCDTGIGIDKAGRAKLFLPFSQVDPSIARRYGGTGLGLTICKEIVERLGGTIGVESKPGRGSTFWFEIPVERGNAPVATPAVTTERDSKLPRLKVLLVEDNAVNQHVASRFLAHLGQEIKTAENGAIAVQMADTEAFDLILMDMQMPVMDGIEATGLIRSGGGKSRLSPIVAMTANASDDDMRKCIEAGMDGFQSKPISVEKLRRVISAATLTSAAAVLAGMGEAGAANAPENSLAPNLSAFHARRAELVEVLGDDDFQEVLDTFFKDAAAVIGKLSRISETDDTTETDRLLHTLKGAADNVGLQSVAKLAEDSSGKRFDGQALESVKSAVEGYARLLAA